MLLDELEPVVVDDDELLDDDVLDVEDDVELVELDVEDVDDVLDVLLVDDEVLEVSVVEDVEGAVQPPHSPVITVGHARLLVARRAITGRHKSSM